MRKINVERYILNTPTHIELTIKESLNISDVASHTTPNVTEERVVSVFDFSSADGQEVIGGQAECGYEYDSDKDKYMIWIKRNKGEPIK